MGFLAALGSIFLAVIVFGVIVILGIIFCIVSGFKRIQSGSNRGSGGSWNSNSASNGNYRGNSYSTASFSRRYAAYQQQARPSSSTAGYRSNAGRQTTVGSSASGARNAAARNVVEVEILEVTDVVDEKAVS